MAIKRMARNTLTSPLSVAMTAGERETVRHAAFLTAQSASAFIRAAAVKAAERAVAREAAVPKAA
jgi:uncharacterized protein (DUF1778 family)